MSEHFLLSRLAGKPPVTKVMGMSEVVAYNWFRQENPVAFATERRSCE
jgi:hypothetical protein